jgi:hypothetical protein
VCMCMCECVCVCGGGVCERERECVRGCVSRHADNEGEFSSYCFVVVNMQEEYTYLSIRSMKEICELAGRVNCTTICCKYLYAF